MNTFLERDHALLYREGKCVGVIPTNSDAEAGKGIEIDYVNVNVVFRTVNDLRRFNVLLTSLMPCIVKDSYKTYPSEYRMAAAIGGKPYMQLASRDLPDGHFSKAKLDILEISFVQLNDNTLPKLIDLIKNSETCFLH